MTKNRERRILRRLRIIDGQLKGLMRMVAAKKYCVHIIHQSSAIKEALSSVENLILEGHLETHVADQMRHKQEKKAIREILSVYKLSQRK